MSLLAQLAISLALVLVFTAAPWLTRRVSTALLVGLLIGVALYGPAGFEVRLLLIYPWSDLVVAALALLGGILLGRLIPPRFTPMLILLLVLSALDVAQIVLTAGTPPPQAAAQPAQPAQTGASGWLALLNFIIRLPAGRYLVGIFDLLLITALAEHWRRRGASYPLALLPGALGFLLAYAFVWLTGHGGLPLIPFFTAGWLCAEAAHHLATRTRTTVPAGAA
jgi:hypothetical protein